MTKEKIRETVEYYNTCRTCGKEFLVPYKDSKQELCCPCRTEAATAGSKEELARFIGATITDIEPVDHGQYVYPGEVGCIEVKTIDGKCIRFVPCDDGEGSCIEWTERCVP